MGLSSIMYIVININEQSARFPHISGLTIGLIVGFYDASAGIFLFLKLVYQADLATMPLLLTCFSIGTSIIWVKTFFFTPYADVKPGVDAFESSAVMKVLSWRRKEEVCFPSILYSILVF